MIKCTDVIKAVVSRVNKSFPDIKFISDDVKEGFFRPSFRVVIDNLRESNFMDFSRERAFTIRLYYFAKDKERNKIENLDMIDSLSELFIDNGALQINDEYSIEIVEDVEFDIVDNIVHCYINLEIVEDFERIDNTPYLEDLEYKE